MNNQEKMVISSEDVDSMEQVLGSKLNINGAVSIMDTREVKTIEVELRTSGEFLMTPFTLLVMNAGLLDFYMSIQKGHVEERVPVVQLMQLLGEYAIIKGEDTAINLTRKQVLILQSAILHWLQCAETKRDEESFNAADYISGKILLLDIKEWLSVQMGM